MSEQPETPIVIERRTTATDTAVPTGQTTNVNIRPDGSADVQVNDGTAAAPATVVEERTTTTTRREI